MRTGRQQSLCDITRPPPSPHTPDLPNKYPEFPFTFAVVMRHCLPSEISTISPSHIYLTLPLICATEPPDVVLGALVVVDTGHGDVGHGSERAHPAAVALQRIPVQPSARG